MFIKTLVGAACATLMATSAIAGVPASPTTMKHDGIIFSRSAECHAGSDAYIEAAQEETGTDDYVDIMNWLAANSCDPNLVFGPIANSKAWVERTCLTIALERAVPNALALTEEDVALYNAHFDYLQCVHYNQ